MTTNTRAEQIEAAAMAVLKNTKVFKSEAITDPALWRALGAALTLPPDPEPDLARVLEQAFVACGRAGANANTRHPLRPLWEMLNRATDTSWTLLNMTPESVTEEEEPDQLTAHRKLFDIVADLIDRDKINEDHFPDDFRALHLAVTQVLIHDPACASPEPDDNDLDTCECGSWLEEHAGEHHPNCPLALPMSTEERERMSGKGWDGTERRTAERRAPGNGNFLEGLARGDDGRMQDRRKVIVTTDPIPDRRIGCDRARG